MGHATDSKRDFGRMLQYTLFISAFTSLSKEKDRANPLSAVGLCISFIAVLIATFLPSLTSSYNFRDFFCRGGVRLGEVSVYSDNLSKIMQPH